MNVGACKLLWLVGLSPRHGIALFPILPLTCEEGVIGHIRDNVAQHAGVCALERPSLGQTGFTN